MRIGGKNKPRKPKEYELIKQYYTKALNQLKNSNNQEASKILYDMPIELYDLSMNILYNTNDEFVNKKLRNLIKEVDNIISKSDDKDFETDLLDDYNVDVEDIINNPKLGFSTKLNMILKKDSTYAQTYK